MNNQTSISKLVTVTLCTYNGAAYLHEQLASILKQTYQNLEVVIVDDCSTDETVTIVQSYAEQDKRICLFINETNLGFNKNFEKALSLANGEWIAIADQDDIWKPNKIEQMIGSWNGEACLLYCSSKKFMQGDEINDQEKPSASGISGKRVAALACRNTVEGHCIILQKSLLHKAIPFPENIFYDWWLGIVAASETGVQWIDEILVWRRIHEQNTYERKIAPAMNEKETWLNHLLAFSAIQTVSRADKVFLETCISMLRTKTGKAVWQRFIFANRDTFFYFKKGPFSIISKWKHSYKLAKKLSAEL